MTKVPLSCLNSSSLLVFFSILSTFSIVLKRGEREKLKMNILTNTQIRPLVPNPFQIPLQPPKFSFPQTLRLPFKTKVNPTQFLLKSTRTPQSNLSNSPEEPPVAASAAHNENEVDDDGIPIEYVKTLAKFKSRHNYIRVLDVSRRADHPLAGSRLLLLDAPGNIHSISFLLKTLTTTYFDVFATFPPILPSGPIGILGFGAGSAARLILNLYPENSFTVHGWELDSSVIAVAREFFGLSKLEKQHRNKLFICIGDALEAEVTDGFAGIMVDLFAKGSVITELQQPRTWEKLKKKLRKGGRIMVNCGGSCVEPEDPSRDGDLVRKQTLKAMEGVFADQVFVLNIEHRKEVSCVALTGPLPDLLAWKRVLPAEALRRYVDMWTPIKC